MKKQNIVRFTLAFACLTASAVILATAAGAAPIPPTPEGVWQVTGVAVDCQTHQDLGPPFTDLMTFTKQDGDKGTAIAQSYGPFPDNAYGPAQMGVWQKGPGHTFTIRSLAYKYDNNGQFNSYAVITGSGQLTGANTFTETVTVQFYDPNGNLLFTLCGRGAATRFQ